MSAKKSSEAFHGKIIRFYRLLAYLKDRKRTIPELAELLGVSGRTVYRYLQTLEEVNVPIDSDDQNRYFFVHDVEDTEEFVFTIEETELIHGLIKAAKINEPSIDSILRKIYINSSVSSVPEKIIENRKTRIITRLKISIDNDRQVILKNYHSVNSRTTSDRFIEPYAFSPDWVYLHALDITNKSDKVCKQFKIDRIGEVLITDKERQYPGFYKAQQQDIFGISGQNPMHITVRMSLPAHLYLRENHPESINYLTTIQEKDGENQYVLQATVNGNLGVSRFILTHMDEIYEIKPRALKEHIESIISSRKF
jgi:predicted DNA-binding transcriptional regulator YafY